MPLASYATSSNHESADGSGGDAGAAQTITTIETIGSSPVIVIILPSNSGHIVNGTTLSHNGSAENVNGVFDDCKHQRSNGHVCIVSSIIQQHLFSSHRGIAAAISSQVGHNLPAHISSREETYTVLELSSRSVIIVEGQTLTSGGIIIVGRETLSLAPGGSLVERKPSLRLLDLKEP
jgi:hypothetical protein